jgi:hypothetical protein
MRTDDTTPSTTTDDYWSTGGAEADAAAWLAARIYVTPISAMDDETFDAYVAAAARAQETETS